MRSAVIQVVAVLAVAVCLFFMGYREGFDACQRANERAVALFLDRRIGYLEITDLIRGAMEHHKLVENPNVDEILAAERAAYEWIAERIE